MLETGVCRQNPTRSDSTASAHIHSAAEIKKKKEGSGETVRKGVLSIVWSKLVKLYEKHWDQKIYGSVHINIALWFKG